MEISEINVFDVNNSATTSLDVVNAFTSDELVSSEDNSFTSTYALNKRIENSTKKAALILTLSISVFTGASSLSNALLGADPVINNFSNCYALSSHTFSYDFDINVENAILRMDIYYLDSTIYSYTFEESGNYKNDVELTQSGEYAVKFYSTNLFDYEKELSKYSFTFFID